MHRSIPDRCHRQNKTSHISQKPCTCHLTFGASESCSTVRDNHQAVRARSQVLAAGLMKMPCRLADGYRRFEGAYCFLRQGQAVQGDYFETSEDFNLLRPHIRSSYSPFISPSSSLFPCPLFLSLFSVFSSFVQSIKGLYTYFVDLWIPFFVFMVEMRLRSHWSASGSTVCSQVA